MAATKTKLGFVGLGHMGGNMAARLLAAGYPVYGESRSRERAEKLALFLALGQIANGAE